MLLHSVRLRIPSILVIIQCFMWVGCNDKPETEAEAMPNIIYVLADDLGYGDISAYNPTGKIYTPNIDRLAAGGMRFTDAHTSSSVCTPTRYGILTGRYNWRSTLKQGVLTGRSNALIPNTRSTVASILKKQGYQTAFIGKWHLGWDWAQTDTLEAGEGWNPEDFDNIDFSKPITNNPNDLGFDYAYGHSGSLDMAPYVYVENGQVTAIPMESTVNTGEYSWWREGPTAPDFIHDQVTPNFFDRAIGYVKEQSNTAKPFFLYLPLPSPHTPILPLKEWQGKSNLNPYGDFMVMIDHYMGVLMQTLDEAGVSNNTLVVFTSDNGCSPAANIEQMKEMGHLPNGQFRGHKADIYEGGHRVPFIVRWPSKIKAGSISDEVVSLNDLMGTVSAISGYELKDDEGEDSYNILPVLEGHTLNEPLREATVHHSINGSFAIRKGEWKLAMCPGSGGWSFPSPGKDQTVLDTLPKMQLFNVKTDPQETQNLLDSNSEKASELKELLTQYIQNGRSTPGIAQTNDGTAHWKQLWWMDEN